MRAIFGVDKYQSGSVTVNGKPLKSGDPASAIEAGVGFCTEDRKKEGLALRLVHLAEYDAGEAAPSWPGSASSIGRHSGPPPIVT